MTNSQLFNFNGGAGPLALQPQNQAGSCLVVKGNAIDIGKCSNGDAGQSFTFGGAAAGGGNNGGGNNNNGGGNNNNGGGGNNNNGGGNNNNGGGGNNNGRSSAPVAASSTTCTKSTRTVTVAPTGNAGNGAIQTSTAAAAQTTTSVPAAGGGGGGGGAAGTGAAGGIPSVNPTDPVPVSRAGGTLQPTAASQSHQRDATAKRAFTNVSIRAPNGQCLFIDPTAGDFRQNLIPVSLVDCTGAPNEKFDLITEGKHNKPNPNRPATLVVSALVGGLLEILGKRVKAD